MGHAEDTLRKMNCTIGDILALKEQPSDTAAAILSVGALVCEHIAELTTEIKNARVASSNHLILDKRDAVLKGYAGIIAVLAAELGKGEEVRISEDALQCSPQVCIKPADNGSIVIQVMRNEI